MDLISPNLKLPYLAPAQAQKHVTHNEALRQLDAIVQLSVTSVTNTPPDSPVNGQRVIIGPAPEGEFTVHPNAVAAYQDGAWAYYAPKTGWHAYIEAVSDLYIFDGSSWQSLSVQEVIQHVNLIGINAQADATNRLSVKSPAILFDHEGDGQQLKINKSGPDETASLILQTQYVSKAELGLTGDDNLHLKVSPDGASFKDSLIANSETGSISFPSGTDLVKMGSSVVDSGGVDYHYGVPNVSTSFYGRQNLTLAKNRVYFCPVYVDRPTKVVGGFVAQPTASSTAGSIMRAGIYKLGKADGNNWQIGVRAADFGTHPADVAGHKEFEPSVSSILEAGWYAITLGTNGAGVMLRNVRTFQPCQSFLIKTGNGTTADLRFSGAASHLYANNAASEIENGFSENWPLSPVHDLQTVQPYGYLPFIPKWGKWTSN